MENGWNTSAKAWISHLGEKGDWGRQFVLDPAMERLLKEKGHQRALDIGCGEGRFCRTLNEWGIKATGIDPTALLIEHAKTLDPDGNYKIAQAERLPFDDKSFDLVVAYLSFIDIDDIDAAIHEAARVMEPGGRLAIANLTSFNTAGAEIGWRQNLMGKRTHYPVDRYMEPRDYWISFQGLTIRNWHRPLSQYMTSLLNAGLTLEAFEEPEPLEAGGLKVKEYRRAPYFNLMIWRKPG